MTISNLQKQEFTTLAHSSRGKACNVQEGIAWWQEQEANCLQLYLLTQSRESKLDWEVRQG